MTEPARSRVVAVRDPLFVLDKPPHLPTEPERGFSTSLLDEAAALLGIERGLLHAHTRLDVGVSGAVLVSREHDVRRRLANEPKALARRYCGIAVAAPEPREGTWDAPIGRGKKGAWSIGGRGARPAQTRYRLIAKTSSSIRGIDSPIERPSLLAFELQTGRSHQIRVHAASAGARLLGDRRYGGARRYAASDGSVWELDRIALHALFLEIRLDDPPWRVVVPPARELIETWIRLGGSAEDWQRAERE